MELSRLRANLARSVRLPKETFQINGIAYRSDEIAPLWLLLYGIDNLSFLSEQIEVFRQITVECCEVSSESCKYLIPIGDWGAGWGPFCLDLTKRDENASEENEETCVYCIIKEDKVADPKHSGKYLVLSFPCSNQGFHQLLYGENMECLLESLDAIFRHIGGVP